MVEVIPRTVKDLWSKWSIRGLVILSLTLQAILVFVAPNRKRRGGKLLLLLVWLAYLVADWSAAYAIGQISDGEDGDDTSTSRELLTFWSPFLLLHLGGPDAITALALEDNELWLRHLFGLVCQAISTLYVLLLSIPDALLVPTVLMLVAGMIKFVERIRALHMASSEKFKESILRKRASFVEKYRAKKEMPAQVILVEVPVRPDRELTHLEVVRYAYKFFNISKCLVADLVFTSPLWAESKKLFQSLNAEEALRILEVELSFTYDALFTKVDYLHTRIGGMFRVIVLGSLVSSLCIFITKNKDEYDRFDVNLTYALVIGGIVLDSTAVLMFLVSDWTCARLRKLDEEDSWLDISLNWLLGFRKLKWRKCRCFKEEDPSQEHEVLDRRYMFRRWSEYIHGYNLIGYCLRIRPKRIHHRKSYINIFGIIRRSLLIESALSYAARGIKSCSIAIEQIGHQSYISMSRLRISLFQNYRVASYVLCPVFLFLQVMFQIALILISLTDTLLQQFLGVRDLDKVIFKSSERLTKDLWTFVFEQVKHKSHYAEDRGSVKMISSARGEWTLRETLSGNPESDGDRKKLLRYLTEVDYDQSILTWHVATEILYQTEEDAGNKYSDREFSKILSDYMIYLLVMQPTLMSAVAGTGNTRFSTATYEAKNFFEEIGVHNSRNAKLASDAILAANTQIMETRRNDVIRSVFYDAYFLAKEIQGIQRKRGLEIWEIVSRVWVELLSYAATQCDATHHAAQLSKGGELISFVWLMMAHFALQKQLQTTKGNGPTAKLIVGH